MIKIGLFAGLAERAGKREIEIPYAHDMSVRELRTAIGEQFPDLHHMIRTCMVAVNQEFADEDDRIKAQDEVVLIPPVSGG